MGPKDDHRTPRLELATDLQKAELSRIWLLLITYTFTTVYQDQLPVSGETQNSSTRVDK